jgi:hypothetical protein
VELCRDAVTGIMAIGPHRRNPEDEQLCFGSGEPPRRFVRENKPAPAAAAELVSA